VKEPELQHPFNGRALNVLIQFGRKLHDWVALRDQAGAGFLLDAILDQTDFRGYIDDGTEEGRDRWANVMEFRGVALVDEGMPLSDFLEQVALVSETDNIEDTANAPTLLTLHAAKGLEFPVVFITGLEEGMLPHSRSLEDAEELAEERRLFYVGLTRARDRVYLLHAFRRTFFGETEVGVPSRFLKEIPNELVSGGRTAQRREQAVTRASSWNWSGGGSTNPAPSRPARQEQRSTPAAPPARPLPEPNQSRATAVDKTPRPNLSAPQFKTGQKVYHAKFGDGIVIESRVTGHDEEVTVAFTGLGIKKLAAGIARLEVGE
jgi:DNA helicase II / ATP-dependent DNA helicase PcrA